MADSQNPLLGYRLLAIGPWLFAIGYLPLLNLFQNTFLPKNPLPPRKKFFYAALFTNPVKIPNDPLFQSYRGQVTRLSDQSDVRYQMSHFTGPKLPIHDRLERYLQRVRNHSRDLFNRDRSTASDINRFSV